MNQMQTLSPIERCFAHAVRLWRHEATNAKNVLETRKSFPEPEPPFSDQHYSSLHDKCIEKHDNAVFTYEKFFGPLPDWV